MPYFPATTMPKILAPETSAEVDGSPSILNAADLNVLIREIVAIEKLLGSADASATGTIMSLLSQLYQILYGYCDGLTAVRLCGSLLPNNSITLPPSILSTTTFGTTLTSATTINVASTAGFPVFGRMTKFNDMTSASGSGSELIAYSGKTNTSFLNCTRAVEGVAQTATSPAVVVGGRATLCLGQAIWGAKSSANSPIGVSVWHDAALNVYSSVVGTPASTFDSKLVEVSYSLSVFGIYMDPSILEVLNG